MCSLLYHHNNFKKYFVGRKQVLKPVCLKACYSIRMILIFQNVERSTLAQYWLLLAVKNYKEKNSNINCSSVIFSLIIVIENCTGQHLFSYHCYNSFHVKMIYKSIVAWIYMISINYQAAELQVMVMLLMSNC